MNLAKEIFTGMVNEEIERQVNENALSCIQRWIDTRECAIISARREKLENVTNNTYLCGGLEVGHVFTPGENQDRKRKLSAKLVKLGYGVTAIGGTYIEGVNTDDPISVVENSFIVTNIHDDPHFFDELFKLSEYFNQDGFLYKSKGKVDVYLYGTNENPCIGYGNRKRVGRLHLNVKTGILSDIGNKILTQNHTWQMQRHDGLENYFDGRKSFSTQQDVENNVKNEEDKQQEKIVATRRAEHIVEGVVDIELREYIKGIFTESEWSKCQVNTKRVIDEIARRVCPHKDNAMLQKVRSELVSE